ncbi:pentatricopeptide repeat-containing protein At1g74600, chloroplastic [Momordica charantia]|uniref:Pentatricopeptide repeat-containing protein At1g74600, chloroplastic n=1 Tax=Momordica charantia TaxID=3673 RepID=A0A6J1C6M8_MOMCH|nr:pentatricopeptide repeat-containing protein At1g74600, chloroplastic [Momordica charantia]XP_022137436.1 pentatricopeptide repeat-containing protein At1g74600, chloroplastic [Momordica charantia]XP_022137437.1 pentatricopeptide repeat-containing protein At1g74600, chloroplastic [Momordica charantia]XP_022137439.1 pentatricopeptide repeat-containing protein At1g74600, chloroplastic [Momordica charantia]
MNLITIQTLVNKTLLSPLRLISSVATADKASNFSFSKVETSSLLDPLQLLNDYVKSRKCSLKNTKVMHAKLLRATLLHSSIYVTNSLLDCYSKSGAMDNALKLFDKMLHLNVISWNIMISGFNQNFLFLESWRTFCRMHFLGFEPSEITYGSVLSACAAMQAPMFGKQIYSLVVRNGSFVNGYVRAGMIDLFAKDSSFPDALRVFNDVDCENVVCWNAIVSAAVRNGENSVALDLFNTMCSGFLEPNSFTFSSVLTACAAVEDLEFGKRVQGRVIKCGGEDVFVETALIDLYAKCGDIDEAVKTFLQMPIRNVVSWTAIISGFVQKNDCFMALKVFKDMRNLGEEINSYTVTSVLTACANPAMRKEAIQLHSWILKAGFLSYAVVVSALINMYSKIGTIDLSMMVFREIDDQRNLSSWAAMITSFAQNMDKEKAIELFQKMLQESIGPDTFCTSSVLSVTDCITFGRQIHCYTLKTGLIFDVSVGSSLFTMYSKCGYLEEAFQFFENMPKKDSVSWASMISCFSEHGYAKEAIHLFRKMLFEEYVPDHITLSAVLTVCSVLHSIQIGREIHGYSVRVGLGKDVAIGGPLVTMYSKCGNLELARRVFETLPQKDQIACSSLVSGYAQHKRIQEALSLFCDLLVPGLAIDPFSVSSILGAIAVLDRPGIGAQLHALIMKVGLEKDVSVGSSLVMVYSKCGSIEDCCKAFEQIGKPDLIGWTAMIVSYAQHGKGAEALCVYELMKKEGIKPDPVTFVGVLSACSHNGLVDEAYFHLNSMVKDYGIQPGYRHYACMVDLLGRCGRLKEAEELINNMPIEPDALIWGTLLAACKVHGDIEFGKLAAKKVMELKPCDTGAYVSLSNICADMGLWEEVLNIRSLMKGAGVTKEPGWSFL